ncbi:MAG: hypothetical protein U0893_08545 [Chloroflexota bacterium]
MARPDAVSWVGRHPAAARLVGRCLGHLAMVTMVLVALTTVFASPLRFAGYTSVVLHQRSVPGVDVQMTSVFAETPPETPAVPSSPFPIGIFEDANQMNPVKFEALVRDIQGRGFDTVLFTNNQLRVHRPLLDVSDRLGINVIWAPSYELHRQWWVDPEPPGIERALDVAGPIVNAIADHPSLIGYNLADEPSLALRDRLALIVQAFKQHDPSRLVTAVLIGRDRVPVLYRAAKPDVLLIDVYPYGAFNPPCNVTMSGFGYRMDFTQYVREVVSPLPRGVPFWTILQTHRFTDSTGPRLREPSPIEVRLEHWLAVGEGSQGIFWFIYTSQQGWRGLRDNPAVFDEVTDLTRRLSVVRPALAGARRVDDQFSLDDPQDLVVTTLERPDASRLAVVVNRSCSESREVRLTDGASRVGFTDLESTTVYDAGTSLLLAPGDGRVLAPIPPAASR